MTSRPSDRTSARLREESERILSVEEVRAYLAVPIGDRTVTLTIAGSSPGFGAVILILSIAWRTSGACTRDGTGSEVSRDAHPSGTCDRVLRAAV